MGEGLTITRIVAAPRDRVWAAWTTPEQFAVWFGTDAVDVPVESISMDVRVGGTWSAIMHLPGDDTMPGATMHWAGEYTAVDPPATLVLTMTDDPAAPAREIVTVVLTDVDGGTEMTVTQTGGNLTEAQYEQTVIGYNGFFDAMDRMLAAA